MVDLDATLAIDLDIIQEALVVTCDRIHERYCVDPAVPVSFVRVCAHELWMALSYRGYRESIGIGSWEGLLAEFTDNARELRCSREWAPSYRRSAWQFALAAHGLDAPVLAQKLAEHLGAERRKCGGVWRDTAPGGIHGVGSRFLRLAERARPGLRLGPTFSQSAARGSSLPQSRFIRDSPCLRQFPGAVVAIAYRR
ncbi:MAG: hypothetical protein OXG33_13150 [Chloroflexi bacterium]|nr:hypothetical protein [Chloroflexota bacterium]